METQKKQNRMGWGKDSFRTRLVKGTLGLSEKGLSERSVNACEPAAENLKLAMEDAKANWKIGVICGMSGSGKTRLAERVLVGAIWPMPIPESSRGLAILDSLTAGLDGCWMTDELTHLLTQVGLGNAVTWLRPLECLSEGEKFRAGLARLLLQGIACAKREGKKRELTLVMDEFGSALDGTTARNVCMCLDKWMRSMGERWRLRLVVVTCHGELYDWLRGDWKLELPDGMLQPRGGLRRELCLRVERCHATAWKLFAEHHYLDGDLGRGVQCFVVMEGVKVVAFCALGSSWGQPGMRRVQRLVVMPAYQGLGIGKKLLALVSEEAMLAGHEVRITTGHPAMVRSLEKDERWDFCCLKKVGSCRHGSRGGVTPTSMGRPVTTFRFVGEGEVQDGDDQAEQTEEACGKASGGTDSGGEEVPASRAV
ncbi:MAG: GNAT family N-acetyltransferase [Pirellulales bacterium]